MTHATNTSVRSNTTVYRVLLILWCVFTIVLVNDNPLALGWFGKSSTALFMALGPGVAVFAVHGEGHRQLAALAGLGLGLSSLVIASQTLLTTHVWTPDRVALIIVVETALLSLLPALTWHPAAHDERAPVVDTDDSNYGNATQYDVNEYDEYAQAERTAEQ